MSATESTSVAAGRAAPGTAPDRSAVRGARGAWDVGRSPAAPVLQGAHEGMGLGLRDDRALVPRPRDLLPVADRPVRLLQLHLVGRLRRPAVGRLQELQLVHVRSPAAARSLEHRQVLADRPGRHPAVDRLRRADEPGQRQVREPVPGPLLHPGGHHAGRGRDDLALALQRRLRAHQLPAVADRDPRSALGIRRPVHGLGHGPGGHLELAGLQHDHLRRRAEEHPAPVLRGLLAGRCRAGSGSSSRSRCPC